MRRQYVSACIGFYIPVIHMRSSYFALFLKQFIYPFSDNSRFLLYYCSKMSLSQISFGIGNPD
jgi:hypothetical protein